MGMLIEIPDRDIKINKSDIEEKIDIIIEKLKTNKYSIYEKEIWQSLIHKVLLNEKEKKNKDLLLDVIMSVNCYKEAEIIEYINYAVGEILEKYTYEDKYVVMKEKVNGSNHFLVTNLTNFGLIDVNNLIKIKMIYDEEQEKTIAELEDVSISENSIILVIDDYVGSGSSIIDILKLIEGKYENQNVIIVSYIWQEKAKLKLEDYINEEKRNNKYIIFEENCILEKSYITKFNEDSDILKYIQNKCSTCRVKGMRFGYKKTGAMLAINGLSPNNNISMLWRNDLGSDWIPPFNRDVSTLVLQNKKEKIIKESYPKMQNYYKSFCYNELLTYDEFKMLLLIFNSHCIQINKITMLLGLDTDEETEEIINKFKELGLIKYEINNYIEFIDADVIRQFKSINNEIHRDALDGYKKECTNKVKF